MRIRILRYNTSERHYSCLKEVYNEKWLLNMTYPKSTFISRQFPRNKLKSSHNDSIVVIKKTRYFRITGLGFHQIHKPANRLSGAPVFPSYFPLRKAQYRLAWMCVKNGKSKILIFPLPVIQWIEKLVITFIQHLVRKQKIYWKLNCILIFKLQRRSYEPRVLNCKVRVRVVKKKTNKNPRSQNGKTKKEWTK